MKLRSAEIYEIKIVRHRMPKNSAAVTVGIEDFYFYHLISFFSVGLCTTFTYIFIWDVTYVRNMTNRTNGSRILILSRRHSKTNIIFIVGGYLYSIIIVYQTQ